MIINQWSTQLFLSVIQNIPPIGLNGPQLLFHSQLALKDGSNASSIQLIKKTQRKVRNSLKLISSCLSESLRSKKGKVRGAIGTMIAFYRLFTACGTPSHKFFYVARLRQKTVWNYLMLLSLQVSFRINDKVCLQSRICYHRNRLTTLNSPR